MTKEPSLLPLLGFGISGYRSFGKDMQYFGPLSKITLLAGSNNSGKSNVLAFASELMPLLLPKIRQPDRFQLSGLDVPQEGGTIPFHLALPVPNSDSAVAALLAAKVSAGASGIDHQAIQILRALLSSAPFKPGHGASWIPIEPVSTVNRGALGFPTDLLSLLSTVRDRVGNTDYGVSSQGWSRLWTALTSTSGGSLNEHWIPGVLNHLVSGSLPNVSVCFVPAFRQMTSDVQQEADAGGKGLIRSLGRLERPSFDRINDQGKFRKIVTFLRDVLQRRDVDIEVPNEQTTVHIRIGSRILPLSNLGTGIHQIVMLAASATLNDNKLICLEEPEMNLHPILQKHLIRYLAENTTNQYLISTHSAHLLDTPGATVYRIENIDGWTRATRVAGPENHLDICGDLGYRPSDLLQANSVIWVEGPSDRIYVTNWLKSLAPDLLEGLHFSIMFYGGSLLKHLSADESEVRDWIALRKLNQNLAVIMDSDRKGANSSISSSKLRVQKELDGDKSGVAWLTDVRTIENYVPPEALANAIKATHPKAKPTWDGRRFSDPFDGVDAPDKISVARKVCEAMVLPTDGYDLKGNLDRIILMIRKANPAGALNAV